MPSEPLPWDRKEYVDHRKHEGGDALGAGGGGGSSSAPRWRDPYHGPRDLPRASLRRPLSGHYRQGGDYHAEDYDGHGCTPSRSDGFWLEDDGSRPSSVRCGSGGIGKESRGSFQRFPFWDSGDFSRRHHHDPHVTVQRLVAAPISSTPKTLLKEHNDKTGGGCDGGLGTGHRFDHRDHSLCSIPWKKWSRPGRLSSAEIGRSELEEVGLEVGLSSGKENPIQSPVTSLPLDEVAPKKKPRLGWGQGLAKYEKQKVEGPQDTVGGSTKAICDNSQKVIGNSECLSPSTPWSATCSTSPAGIEDKLCCKAVNDDNGITQNNDLPGSTFLRFHEDISSILADLFQSEDAFSGDSTFTRHSAMNKLLKLKEDISDGLEKIECEIDLLEKELKSLDCDVKTSAYQSSFKLTDDSTSEPHVQPLVGVSNDTNNLKDQKGASVEVTFVDEHVPCSKLVEHDAVVEEINIVHLETVPSKINKLSTLAKKLSDSVVEKLAGSPLSIEDERWKVTELQRIVDWDDRGRLMLTSEDRNINCVDGGSGSVYVRSDKIIQGKTASNLITSIMDSNRNAAKQASKVFGTSLLTNSSQLDVWGLANFTLCRKNDLRIKEKLANHKCLLKFKERVLILKFRALHHLWKEDLRLLSVRKLHTKSSKCFDLSNHPLQNSSQKQRSSIRSQFTLAGNVTLVPTMEIVNFTSKLLSDSQIKLCRNNLKMPTLILDDKERRYTRFVMRNGLIEHPPSYEKERALINPWSQEEKEVFMEMLAKHGKDFTKISSSLNHKTAADCIEFYYKNHKSESFKEVKKCLDLRKQQQSLPANTYLVASGKKWNHEVNSVSLNVLGAGLVVAAHNHGTARSQKFGRRTVYGTNNYITLSCGSAAYLERANNVDISGQERESVAADVLAGICDTLSSEAMSSCVMSSIEPAEKMNYIPMDRLLTTEDEDIFSDEDCAGLDSADWTDEEKSIFIHALSMYGKDFSRISTCMRTRSREQCKIFFSKARKCLGLDTFHQVTVKGGMPFGDTNGGRSDTDNSCLAERDSAICSTQSCSKMDVNVSQSVANTSYEGIVHAGGTHFHAESNRSNEQDDGALVGANLESGKEKVDNKHVSIFHDDKLVNKGSNIQFDAPPKESIVAVPGCTEVVQLCEVADSAYRETKVGVISNIVSPTELIVNACLEIESKPLTSSIVCNADIDGDFPADGLKKEVDSKVSLVTEVGLSNEKVANINFTTNGNGPLCSPPNSNASGATLLEVDKVNVCHHLTFVPNYQQIQLDLLPCLPKKPQNILLKQENSHSVPLNSFLPDPSFCFSGSLNVSSQTTMNFEEHGNKRHKNMVKRDLYQQYMLRNLPANEVDKNMHILRSYPLQALNQDVERESDLPAGEKPSLLEIDSKRNGVSQSNKFSVSNMHRNNSNLSNLSHSRSSLLCPSGNENQPEAQLRACVKTTCSEPEELGSGDVKLFGKIRSHPSSLQKFISSSNESNERPSSPKLGGSLTVNCTGNGKDGNHFISAAGSSGQVGLEELPVGMDGLWYGKRKQIGCSSLPEIAAELTKYQVSPTGVSSNSAKDGIPSSNGVLTDYHQSYMQHLLSGGKWLESFSEMQKMNEIKVVSEFQQQGRNTPLGSSMTGGGTLIGGRGVSDPVAALKMHYAARSQLLSGKMESRIGDIEGS